MKKTDFFILGAPKCGTTSFAQILGSHPGICVSEPKEPHYFDVSFPNGIDSYINSCFSGGHEEQLFGEATPSYLMLPYVANRIKSFNADAKLIVIIRNPVERAFSSWWMLHSRGMEKLSFLEAISAELNQGNIFESASLDKLWIEQVKAIKAGRELPLRTYLEAGYYSKHLKRYYDLFPEENIKVIFTSDLKDSAEKVVNDTIGFLGLESSPDVNFSIQSNKALGGGAAKVLRIVRFLGLMKLRSVLPENIREALKAKLSKAGDPATLSDRDRKEVATYFSRTNAELESLICRKVPFS